MSEATKVRQAKTVVKNNCWIVEEDGTKVAAILAGPSGVTLVKGARKERFPSLKLLCDRYNIVVDKTQAKRVNSTPDGELYGYPIKGKAYNSLWDVQKKLPIYTTSSKSKSYYCAGYYKINFEGVWSTVFCPKTIILNRHEYLGPFKSKKEGCVE